MNSARHPGEPCRCGQPIFAGSVAGRQAVWSPGKCPLCLTTPAHRAQAPQVSESARPSTSCCCLGHSPVPCPEHDRDVT